MPYLCLNSVAVGLQLHWNRVGKIGNEARSPLQQWPSGTKPRIRQPLLLVLFRVRDVLCSTRLQIIHGHPVLLARLPIVLHDVDVVALDRRELLRGERKRVATAQEERLPVQLRHPPEIPQVLGRPLGHLVDMGEGFPRMGSAAQRDAVVRHHVCPAHFVEVAGPAYAQRVQRVDGEERAGESGRRRRPEVENLRS